MRTVRIFFTKHGRSKYISHLDLNRCMARAFRRAGVPVWYTQGFNPHPHIVFAQALSLFYESDGEIMDIRLDAEMADDEVARRLADQMPEGIEILRVAPPVLPLSAVAAASYRMELEFDGRPADSLRQAMVELCAHKELLYEKKTKRGTRIIDVAAHWRAAEWQAADGLVTVRAVLPASPQENINPACLIDVMTKYASLQPDFDQVTRTALLDEKWQPFA